MVFVFGVDVPLVELILGFSLITFIMLLEVTVVMIIMFYQMRRSKETTERLIRLAHILLHITQKEKKDMEILTRLSHILLHAGNGKLKHFDIDTVVKHPIVPIRPIKVVQHTNGGRK